MEEGAGLNKSIKIGKFNFIKKPVQLKGQVFYLIVEVIYFAL